LEGVEFHLDKININETVGRFGLTEKTEKKNVE
jgi:hypothetical protein